MIQHRIWIQIILIIPIMSFIVTAIGSRFFFLNQDLIKGSVSQSLIRVLLCDPMDCSMPGLPVHHRLPEFTQTRLHWVSDAIQPSHPLSSPSFLAFNLSQHQVFSNESTLRIRWPKYWSFRFNISPYVMLLGVIALIPFDLEHFLHIFLSFNPLIFFFLRIQEDCLAECILNWIFLVVCSWLDSG